MSIFNSHDNLFFWGPINGRPIYISYFMESIAKRTHRIYKHKWPKFLFCFVGDKMTFICNNDELVAQGKKYFNDWIMDDSEFEKVKSKYSKARNDLGKIEDKIYNLDKLNEVELKKLYLNFHEKYLVFWDHGLVPEISNWGGEIILKDNLKNVPAEDFTIVYEKLSAPTGLSFYQEEEQDLLKVKKGEVNLGEHRKIFFWINNSYLDSVVLDNSFFEKRLSELNNANLKQEIEKIESFIPNLKKEKKNIIEKYNLLPEIEKISDRLGYCIYWQDKRKGNIFRTNHFIKLFLLEFSRRYHLPLPHLEQYWCWELPALLNGQRVSELEMQNRLEKQAGFVVAEEEKNIVFTTDRFETEVAPVLNIKIDEKINEIRGLSVSIGSGVVRGRAKILLDPRDLDKMQEGDILLAPMTSPEYILALRKAAAVVTDTGGMTCHAAIVSRELKIPCVVGTKFATKIFLNGDLIEVDAKKGVVKKYSV